MASKRALDLAGVEIREGWIRSFRDLALGRDRHVASLRFGLTGPASRLAAFSART